MGDFLVFERLVIRQDRPPTLIGEVAGATERGNEVLTTDLAPSNDPDRESVGDGRPELLEEIQSERRPAGARTVKETDLRVQTNALQRAHQLRGNQAVEEAEKG